MYRASNVTRRHVSNRLWQPDMAATRVVVSRFTTPPTDPSPPLMLMRHIKKKKKNKTPRYFLPLSLFLPFFHISLAYITVMSLLSDTTSQTYSDPETLYLVAHQILQQAIDLLNSIPDDQVYAKPSHVMFGGSIGKHIRLGVYNRDMFCVLPFSSDIRICKGIFTTTLSCCLSTTHRSNTTRRPRG